MGFMNDSKERMQKTVRHLAEQLAGIRPGTLSVGCIETFRVSIQGNTVPVGKGRRTPDDCQYIAARDEVRVNSQSGGRLGFQNAEQRLARTKGGIVDLDAEALSRRYDER